MFPRPAGQRVSSVENGLEDTGGAVGIGPSHRTLLSFSREGPGRALECSLGDTQQGAAQEELRPPMHRRPKKGQPGNLLFTLAHNSLK